MTKLSGWLHFWFNIKQATMNDFAFNSQTHQSIAPASQMRGSNPAGVNEFFLKLS